MDIAFHYFAIKTLAVYAGFSNADAQTIAQSSQMVDDFDYTMYWRCTNVPDFIKNNPRYDLLVALGNFNPAQTGFLCDGILGKTDYLNLAIPRFQRFTCTPFHFIYHEQDEIDNKEYRVVPATFNNGSIISNLLLDARAAYRAAPANSFKRRKALMKIGMLLHIFADTYAHQMFSGFNANVNLVGLISVTNNITRRDETEKYKSKIIKFLDTLRRWAPLITPAIGHMMLEHIPDYTHLSFSMSYKDDEGKEQNYNRSNTDEFIKVSRIILNYLLSLNGRGKVTDARWAAYREQLRASFLTDISEASGEEEMVASLKQAWHTRGCTYDYSSKRIKKSFVLDGAPHELSETSAAENDCDAPLGGTRASEEFYIFNANADEVLIELYGDHPRKL